MITAMMMGAGTKFLGDIIGGASRSRESKKRRQDVQKTADQGQRALESDQARAVAYARDDEARMKAATGYDLVKLRNDAIAAGFNPLTVLNATGGAGYDQRGAVMTTPFVSLAQGYFDKAGLEAGLAGASIQAAGYFGDALSGLGSEIIGGATLKSQQEHEMRVLQTQMAGRNHGITGAAKISASPVKGPRSMMSIFGADARIPVYEIDGSTAYVSARNADALGKRPFDVMMTEDWQRLIGGVADLGGFSKAVSEGRGNQNGELPPSGWETRLIDKIRNFSPWNWLPNSSGGWSDRGGKQPPLRIVM